MGSQVHNLSAFLQSIEHVIRSDPPLNCVLCFCISNCDLQTAHKQSCSFKPQLEPIAQGALSAVYFGVHHISF